jgi:hypothetical protein
MDYKTKGAQREEGWTTLKKRKGKERMDYLKKKGKGKKLFNCFKKKGKGKERWAT